MASGADVARKARTDVRASERTLRVGGRLRVPGDKSISHRALICAALGDGQSRVRGLLDSADIRSSAGILRALGVDMPTTLGDDVVVNGVGLRGLRAARAALDCGNSGTSARLFAGIVSACAFTSRLVGDESLSRRPMHRVARPLEAMGARFEFERGDGLPVEITGGALRGIAWTSEAASAQVKSAILFAALLGGVEAEVREPARSRTHTERMLSARGVPITGEGTTVGLSPVGRLLALDMTVPADPSSAAFFAGLAALSDEGDILLEGVCVDETRTGFYRALHRMGVVVELTTERDEGGEAVADIRVRAGALRGIVVAPDEIPSMIDELPLLACLASRADGDTVITGAAELRVKESDRIAAVVGNLRALGASAEEQPDGMVISGSRTPLRGRVATRGDHRLAMAFGILGAVPGNEIAVDDPGCVAVSYPAFWEHLRRMIQGE